MGSRAKKKVFHHQVLAVRLRLDDERLDDEREWRQCRNGHFKTCWLEGEKKVVRPGLKPGRTTRLDTRTRHITHHHTTFTDDDGWKSRSSETKSTKRIRKFIKNKMRWRQWWKWLECVKKKYEKKARPNIHEVTWRLRKKRNDLSQSDKSTNRGLISEDRSTEATLLFTIPRSCLSRLHRIYLWKF